VLRGGHPRPDGRDSGGGGEAAAGDKAPLGKVSRGRQGGWPAGGGGNGCARGSGRWSRGGSGSRRRDATASGDGDAHQVPSTGAQSSAGARERVFHRPSAELWMTTGKIRVDIDLVAPHPRTKICVHARAHNPPQAQSNTHVHYPRIPTCPRVRPYTRKFWKKNIIQVNK